MAHRGDPSRLPSRRRDGAVRRERLAAVRLRASRRTPRVRHGGCRRRRIRLRAHEHSLPRRGAHARPSPCRWLLEHRLGHVRIRPRAGARGRLALVVGGVAVRRRPAPRCWADRDRSRTPMDDSARVAARSSAAAVGVAVLLAAGTVALQMPGTGSLRAGMSWRGRTFGWRRLSSPLSGSSHSSASALRYRRYGQRSRQLDVLGGDARRVRRPPSRPDARSSRATFSCRATSSGSLAYGILVVGVWRAISQAEFGRAVADERARVAREIHDGLAQYLFAISTQVSMLESGAPLDEVLPRLKRAATSAQQEARFAVLALSSGGWLGALRRRAPSLRRGADR